jgi:hypothetical protein
MFGEGHLNDVDDVTHPGWSTQLTGSCAAGVYALSSTWCT